MSCDKSGSCFYFEAATGKHHDLVSSRSLNSACTKRGMVIQDLESWRAKNFKTTRRFSVDTSLVVNWGENRIFRSLYSHYSCQSLLSVSICYSALALLHPRICLIPLSPSLRDISTSGSTYSKSLIVSGTLQVEEEKHLCLCASLLAPFTLAFIFTVSCWPVVSLLQTENRPFS